MKNLFLFTTLVLFFFSCKNVSEQQHETSTIHKEDLAKLKWIEGSWTGLYDGQPFYETYRILNDSTMQIITHANVGTDSVRNNIEHFEWSDGAYYLGDARNYKAVHMTDTSIYMIPVTANNDILWNYVNDTVWTAVLKSPRDTFNFRMSKVTLPDSITITIH
jgi:hypothetical protein